MIIDMDATSLSRAIHSREVSCREVMQAYLDQIDRHNALHLALVSLVPAEQALAQADQADAELARGQSRGWMHGMPQAVKDLSPQQDSICTMGSPLLKDYRPTEDGLMVSRLRQAGAIFIGRSNVPEFGLGSHSFNEVFGVTRNAWDASKTAGGSSGGAAVALALKMLPVADGSDFMGSLRNPAGWNNIVGMRPSQGRVPYWPSNDVWLAQLGTEGPMGRRVQDVARLLAVQAGPDERVPLARLDHFDLQEALSPIESRSIRVAWLGDLQGHLPMEAGILDLCSAALTRWQGAGARVESAQLGYSASALWESWLIWRRALVGPRIGSMFDLRPDARNWIKPEALWEFDQAAHTGVAALTHASSVRSAFHSKALQLFERYDVLAIPSAQAWPFDAGLRWPKEIMGQAMDTYHRWMEVTIYATLLGAPCVCMPVGFGGPNPDKPLPMGIQLIGRPGADAQVLRIAQDFENQVVGTPSLA